MLQNYVVFQQHSSKPSKHLTLNVAVRVIWRRDVRQCQINVDTTLCISTLKITMLNNVESTLSISTLMLTTLGNAKTMLLFSKSSFTLINIETTLIDIETTLYIRSFWKSQKEQKNIFELRKKMIHLINYNCFLFWSIKTKGKHGTIMQK